MTDKLLFNLGRTVCTSTIHKRIENDPDFREFTWKSLTRHNCGDWGDLSSDDITRNNDALKDDARLFSAYKYDTETTIWIITEADRSATTILHPNEY